MTDSHPARPQLTAEDRLRLVNFMEVVEAWHRNNSGEFIEAWLYCKQLLAAIDRLLATIDAAQPPTVQGVDREKLAEAIRQEFPEWNSVSMEFDLMSPKQAREHADVLIESLAPAHPVTTEDMEARKDAAYLERNRLVALVAKLFPSGIKRTAIEGWSDDWHGCVYIDLPSGQASWHYHDSQAFLFEGLPPYQGEWDGHTTEQKYERIAAGVGGAPGKLQCYRCNAPHFDTGEWATRPHKTHLCAYCGYEWRPFDFATVGVSILPSEEKDTTATNKRALRNASPVATSTAHPVTTGPDADAVKLARGIVDGSPAHRTIDGRTYAEPADINYLAREVLRLSAPTGAGWRDISTLPDSNDLVWLHRRDEIKGPVDPHAEHLGFVEHDGWDYWAPCEPPALPEPPAPAPEEVR